ncbi:MAG: hypothetical protein QNK03_25235 [Myxococcota bacterium]|nr:hypothetical protein [Myxococcota bacterium]
MRFFWLALLLALPTRAEVPGFVDYQGRLFDAAGAPADGPVELLVMIVDTGPTVPVVVYSERHDAVDLVDGIFHIRIGTGSEASGPFDASVFASPDLELVIDVDGEMLAPAQPVGSVPYALRAGAACFSGDRITCYTGPEPTLGVGLCQTGQRVCGDAGFGPCVDEVVPEPEVCNGLDDDCDGAPDDGSGLAGCRDGFADTDGDGFGDDALGLGCYCGTIAAAGGDCDDANADARPNQEDGFTAPRANGSFDYNCDDVETLGSDVLFAGCTVGTLGNCFGDGWVDAVPACGETGTFRTCGGIGGGRCNTIDTPGTVQPCL